MITILLSLFSILLLIISWFFFSKASSAFSILVSENKQPALDRFCSLNGWLYLIFALVSFVGLILDSNTLIAGFLIVVSLYTANVAWQIATFIKK